MYVRIHKVGFKIGFNRTKKRQNEHPHPSSTSILHNLIDDLIVKPPMLHNSCSSTSTTPPCLLPAIILLCLCRHSFVDFCLFVIVVSTVVAPPPLTVDACQSLYPLRLFSRCLPAVLHLILPSLLVRRCTCCALVDCCLPLVTAPLLPLRHHICLSVDICHWVC
jgi:hypothetical protein